ncbi:Holliday junction resolvase [Candidatus Woesearchaeota archaeon]|nr:Holliday junction resolvase [Candidatus Woesearchaeota archaeon]
MSRKSIGINAERELIHLFWSNGWSAVRVAGSGSSHYPSCDIIASNAVRKLAIESKVTKDKGKYFSKEEIGQLREFSEKFGAESWIGIKFKNLNWFFISLEDLEIVGKNYVVSVELAKNKGLLFNQLINRF